MNKSFLGALIIAVTAILFFAFFMPAYDELSGASTALADRRQLLADAQSAQENVANLTRQYATNADAINRILLALPKQKQYDYLTSSIQAAAATSGVQLLTLTIAQPQKTVSEYQTIQVTAQMTGTYPAFVNFLAALEHSLRLYDIAKISLAAGEHGSGGGLAITLQFNAYSLK